MAIWSRIVYTHPENNTEYEFLHHFDESTGAHEFRQDCSSTGPIDFDPATALRAAMEREAAKDTPEGYRKAAEYRNMLKAIEG